MSKRILYLASGLAALVFLGQGCANAPAQPTAQPQAGQTIDKDTNVAGDYTVSQSTVLKNGAKLTVNGNLTIDQELSCDGGPLNVTVKGKLTVNDKLTCIRREGDSGQDSVGNGIVLVAMGQVNFAKSAKVNTNGHFQVADNASKLANTQSQIDSIYADSGEPTGQGVRLGPLVPKQSKPSAANLLSGVSAAGLDLVSAAQAQGVPNVVIGGNWIIGNGNLPPIALNVPRPAKGVEKIILNFNFGPGKQVNLQNFTLAGPDGMDGTDDKGKSCNARGGDGKDALRFNIRASDLNINNFNLTLGSGGKGGGAETKTDCDPASAKGGDGGKSGNFKFLATGSIKIAGVFSLTPGNGGRGGDATATGKKGKDSCAGEKGGDAGATGGVGAANLKDLSTAGSVSGLENIQVAPSRGGDGGKATANGGDGGNGNAPSCSGGPGGKATSFGGKGGDASVTIPGGAKAVTNGGQGGDANSKGGKGGDGVVCHLPGQAGGSGGKGGDTSAQAGKGGTSDNSFPHDGSYKKIGGDGGNGKDGSGPGQGGRGGAGDPAGKKGSDGKPACTPLTNKSSTITPPPTNTPVTTPPPATQPVPPTASMTFKHVMPGVYSEVYTKITGTPGAKVTCGIQGTGVMSGGFQTGTIASDGTVTFTTRINAFGFYMANCKVGDSQVTANVNVQ